MDQDPICQQYASCIGTCAGDGDDTAVHCAQNTCSGFQNHAVDNFFNCIVQSCLAVCSAATCTNQIRDGSESDVDCGGGCLGCATGAVCSTGLDCQSHVCASGQCLTATCQDGVRNGAETGVDCGAPGCAVCPSCDDGIQNGNESDVDCGGSCNDCATGRACTQAADCLSNACSAGVCQPPACSPGCQEDEHCGAGADCQSGSCTSGVCARPNCDDGVKNGGEADVDCGGGVCPAGCDTGATCTAGGDCQSFVCTGAVCAAATCADGVKNRSETDVDCGGPDCPGCGVDGFCLQPSDCRSLSCENGQCVGCRVPADCPPASGPCEVPFCNLGRCGVMYPSGTVCSPEGDVCDGNGGCAPP